MFELLLGLVMGVVGAWLVYDRWRRNDPDVLWFVGMLMLISGMATAYFVFRGLTGV